MESMDRLRRGIRRIINVFYCSTRILNRLSLQCPDFSLKTKTTPRNLGLAQSRDLA
jgi:hypothetical protein